MQKPTAFVYLQSPAGDDIKEIEATPEKLTPYLVAGWRQVPAPANPKPAAPAGGPVGY